MSVDTSRDPRMLHPELQKAWEYGRSKWAELYPHEPQPFLTCTYRGPIDQQRAYDAGKSNARPGQSYHNTQPALAFDIAFVKDGRLDWRWELFAWFAAILGPSVEWGGEWPMRDGPHFQLANYSMADVRAGKEPPRFIP